MPLTTKTLDELIDLCKAVVRHNVEGADTSEGSDYDLTAKLLSTVYQGNQGQAQYLGRQVLGNEAEGEYLARHMKQRGLTTLKATKASGKILLTGDNTGLNQPAGSTLTHADGTKYVMLGAGVPATNVTWAIAYALSNERLVLQDMTGVAVGHSYLINGELVAVRTMGPDYAGTKVFVDIYPPLSTLPDPGDTVDTPYGAVVDIESEEAGANTSKASGETLTVDDPYTYESGGTWTVNSVATILELSGGGNDMTEAEQQAAVTAYNAERPQSANPQWYREQAVKTPGVTLEDALVYANAQGLGTIEIHLLSKVSEDRRVSDATVVAVQAHLDSIAPYSDLGNIFVQGIKYGGTATDVDVTITPAPGYEPDWDSASMAVDEGNSDETTGYIEFTSANPIGIIDVGDRVTFAITDVRAVFFVREVRAVGSNYIIVDPFQSLTLITDVFPGGPLSQACFDAIKSVFTNMGPNDYDSANDSYYYRHPSSTELWSSGLRLSDIIATLKDVEGMADVVPNDPSVNTYPSVGETLHLGQVTIQHG